MEKDHSGDEADAVDNAEDDKLWTLATFISTNSTYIIVVFVDLCGVDNE